MVCHDNACMTVSLPCFPSQCGRDKAFTRPSDGHQQHLLVTAMKQAGVERAWLNVTITWHEFCIGRIPSVLYPILIFICQLHGYIRMSLSLFKVCLRIYLLIIYFWRVWNIHFIDIFLSIYLFLFPKKYFCYFLLYVFDIYFVQCS